MYLKQFALFSLVMVFINSSAQNKLDIQGHRGARGILPENTIPAFIYAVENGATTLEMDVVISKDQKVVVSHEPYMSAAICSHPDGTPVQGGEEKNLNIYEMTYDEVKQYDCGSRGNEKFPDQKATAACKPLLSGVIDTVEKIIKEKDLKPVRYNIEIKRRGNDKFYPQPMEFVKLVHEVIEQKGIKGKVIVQSFDKQSLQAMHELDPDMKLALLTFMGKNVKHKIKKLGFTPDVYSPRHGLVNEKNLAKAHEMGMKVIPWTVNQTDDMKQLVEMGVDGLITDFPQVAVKLFHR